MSGFLEWFQLTLGVFSVASVMYVNYRLKSHRFFDDDMNDLGELRFGRAIIYLFWITGQVILAGFHVLTVIIRPKMPIETTMVRFKADLPSAHAKMILGNSISLTPGTLTIDIIDDLFIVHALDSKSYEGITSDAMPRQVLKLFEKEERQVVSDIQITTQIKEEV